ncbi:MAG: ATP-dependent DNA helicase RecG [Thermovirgaceae bacterium]
MTAEHIELGSPVRFLKGVGPVRAEKLARLGIETVEDLLWHFPRRYEDRRQLTPLASLEQGRYHSILARIVSIEKRRTKRRNMSLTVALLTDGTSLAQAVWFNRKGLDKILQPGSRASFYGKAESWRGVLQISNPEFEVLDENESPENTGAIVPVYPGTQGLFQRWIRETVRRTLELVKEKLEDVLPGQTIEKHGFLPFPEAVSQMHFPEDEKLWREARRRLAFEEFFFLQLAFGIRRNRYEEDSRGPVLEGNGRMTQAFLHDILPFSLTPAQEKVFGEIRCDISRAVPMNRLLQGDVGSGKTVVAVMFLLCAVDAGCQAALMAPTEILARQHYENIRDWFDALGLEVVLLSGSLPQKEKNDALERIASGGVNVVVGTHALLEDDVRFSRLGAVVVDEQHRFGVLQRNRLSAKGEHPHVLVMTATPIPRTLTLSVYGDLSVSVIDELPPGRKDVLTQSVPGAGKRKLLGFLKRAQEAGRQVYWVCPLIEENEDLSVPSAERRHDQLAGLFGSDRVGLLHGRLPGRDKEKIMESFARNEISLLVATTVIEVGIDIPNATVMVIEEAHRFGLSQLHQLRGRIGRGGDRGYCFLLGDPATEDGKARIEAMCETKDGFRIAEKDLELRGPGEVCGLRQHGVTDFRVANLIKDRELLERAREEAFELIGKDPGLENHGRLKSALIRRFETTLDLAVTG